MPVIVEVWYRRKRGAEYHRHGVEQVAALLEAGSSLTFKVDGEDRRVIVDKAIRTTVGAGVGTIWVTET
jgi:hypothetical protein